MSTTLLGTRRAARAGAVAVLASAVASAAVLAATPAQAAVTNQNLVGTAAGTTIVALGGIVESGPTAASGLNTPETGKTASNSIATVNLPGIATTGVISTSVATTAITGGKRIVSTARVDGLNLLGGLVKATAVESTSAVSVVNGIATPASAAKFVDLAVGDATIPLNPGKNFTVNVPGIAKVVINKAVATQFSDNAAREVGAGIEITLLSALGSYGAGTVIDVAPTAAAAVLPSASLGAPVGGRGYATQVVAVINGTPTVTSGPTALATMPQGGTAGQNLTNNTVGVHVGTLLNSGTVSSTVNGSRTVDASRSTVSSGVQSLNLLGGLIKADAVSSKAQASVVTGGTVARGGQSNLVNLVIAGKAIPLNVAANTKISVLGLVTVTINEQVRTATGITVRALDVKVIGAGLGLPIGSRIEVATANAWVVSAG